MSNYKYFHYPEFRHEGRCVVSMRSDETGFYITYRRPFFVDCSLLKASESRYEEYERRVTPEIYGIVLERLKDNLLDHLYALWAHEDDYDNAVSVLGLKEKQ